MTNVSVTVEHPGAHEPSGETFGDDFGKALTAALRDAGLKRGSDGDYRILSYTSDSGVSTTYEVDVDTEVRADAKVTKTSRKKSPVGAPGTEDEVANQVLAASVGDKPELLTTDEATEKGATANDTVVSTVTG